MHTGSFLWIFTRAPLPGRVKTRLIPRVGEAGAAALQRAFLDDLLALTRGIPAARALAIDGPIDHPALVELAGREGIERVPQVDGDLGARMEAALHAGFTKGAGRVAIVGSDLPALRLDAIAGAFERLRDADVVLGPADDGGYWLIGARPAARPHLASLFDGVAWGTDRVLAETGRRLRERAIPHALAGRAFDVDEPADLDRLRAALALDPALAPATRAALAGLP